jgi:uncharacterized protein YjeT (DUF2065 family)
MSVHLPLGGVEKRLRVIGLILIGVGVLCNPWGLTTAFSPDGVLEFESKAMIWLFDLSLIGLGLVFIAYHKLVASQTFLVHFYRTYPRLLACLVGIILSVGLLLVAEGTFYGINTAKQRLLPRETSEDSGRLLQDDADLGYRNVPDNQVVARKTVNGALAVQARYSTDAYGRRITPLVHAEKRTQFLLYMGDSFTFGAWVNDNETLPSYVAQLAPAYHP